MGALLSLASTATRPEELHRLRQAVWQARRGWIGPALVLNTQDATGVDAWLALRHPRPRAARRARPTAPCRLPAPVDLVPPQDAALAGALRARPLAHEIVRRLERFLAGDDDPALLRVLEAEAGNALQRAFELVVTARSGSD